MTDIQDSDYNSLRNLIVEVMGPGTGSFGYGQTVVSSPVFAGNIITAQQWDDLRFDIINAKLHQDGVLPSVVDAEVGDVIGDQSGDPKVNYANVISELRENRFKLAPSGVDIEQINSPPAFSGQWNDQAVLEISLDFQNTNDARYFFNSGSRVEITPTLENYTTTAQNNSWNSLLTEVGAVIFGMDYNNDVNFYDLTDDYQSIFQQFSSAAYANNSVLLEAKSNVPDNSNGGATKVDIRLSLKDDYVDPDVVSGFPANTNPPSGFVDGELNFNIVEVKAASSLLPTGTGQFNVTSPTYSVSNISAS